MAGWAPLVPAAKIRLGLDEAQLGALLLCVGLGSVLTMPFSGGLAGRFGCRRVILVSGVLACSALPIVAGAQQVAVLAAGLFLFGAGVGAIDVTMNIQAVIVEKASGRAMMSGFHGLFSVGGILGAGAVTGLLALGLSALPSAATLAGLGALLLVAFMAGLLPYGGESGAPAFAIPRGRVLLIGALCFVMFLAEGAVLDWSGVLLSTVAGAPASWAGLGYVAFSATMTLGRLLGDWIVKHLGPSPILAWGGLCASAGFALAAFAPSWPVSVVGFGLVGAGASNVVPVLFTAAGRQTAMPSNLAIAGVTTLGYAGILSGPALIGFVARAGTLPIALMLVSAMLLGVTAFSRAATRTEAV